MAKKTKRSFQWIKDKKIKYVGIHLLADFWGGKIIEDSKEIEEILTLAAKKAGNTPLKFTFHKFNPHGSSGVLLLAESHIALHTWPERDYIAFDIFTCGNKAFPFKALEFLRKKFKPKKIKIREIKRGK